MPDRPALKRLTASDLTLFEALFRRLAAGNQKAINLNADVFISVLYPALPAADPTGRNEITVSLCLFGPGHKQEHRLARKIIKNPTYKNWRLDGEFVPGPEGDPGRYDTLRPGDLAVMSFQGDPTPTAIDVVLLSQDLKEDAELHSELFPLLDNRSMIAISSTQLAAAISRSGTAIEHPVFEIVADPALDAALEDVALGGERGVRALLRRGARRRVSAVDLIRARQNADRIGALGEGLINALLMQKQFRTELADFEWASATNAICPYDFRFRTTEGAEVKLDVKSTGGPFENEIHISAAELAEAATATDRYDLYRVYELTEESGKLRVAEDIRTFASNIMSQLKLPPGVRCDGFSVAPSSAGLNWGDEVHVIRPAGDEEST